MAMGCLARQRCETVWKNSVGLQPQAPRVVYTAIPKSAVAGKKNEGCFTANFFPGVCDACNLEGGLQSDTMVQTLPKKTCGGQKWQARLLPKWVCCCNAEVIGPFKNKCSISLDGVVLAYVGGASAALQKEITQKRPDGERIGFLATTSWPSRGKLVWCPAPFGSVLALGQNTA